MLNLMLLPLEMTDVKNYGFLKLVSLWSITVTQYGSMEFQWLLDTQAKICVKAHIYNLKVKIKQSILINDFMNQWNWVIFKMMIENVL